MLSDVQKPAIWFLIESRTNVLFPGQLAFVDARMLAAHAWYMVHFYLMAFQCSKSSFTSLTSCVPFHNRVSMQFREIFGPHTAAFAWICTLKTDALQ